MYNDLKSAIFVRVMMSLKDVNMVVIIMKDLSRITIGSLKKQKKKAYL